MRSLVLVSPTLICSALIPGNSTLTVTARSVSQTSTGGDQAPVASGPSASAASCRVANSRPIRSRRRFISSASSPLATTAFIDLHDNGAAQPGPPLTLLNLLGSAGRTRTHQVFQFMHELGN